MVDIVEILIEENSVNTGTGNFTLTGRSARRTFNEGYGLGGIDKFFYFITHQTADQWEHGTGHLLNSTTLVRDTILMSSNANLVVNFSPGTKDVVSDRPGNLPVVVGDIRFNPDLFTSPSDFTPGTTSSLTLTNSPTILGNALVSFNGVIQQSNEYSILGNIITFNVPIPLGITNIEIRSLIGGGIFTQERIDDVNITSSGTFNIVHGFPSTPKNISLSLINIVAELGYVIGEEVILEGLMFGTNQGVSVRKNVTNIIGQFGKATTTFSLPNLTDGTINNITNTNWNLRITSWI